MAKLQLWRWRGMAFNEQQQTGYLWATQQALAALQLQQQGICVLNLRRMAVRNIHWGNRQRIHFIRQLATLLQAGIPLTEGLTLLAQQHPQAQWQALLTHLARQLHEGVAFSVAISQWPWVFPPLFTALLHTGEMTGKLDECCLQLATQQEQQWRLQQKVSKALRYPALILVLVIFIIAGMLGFVLPEFAAIYQSFNAPLPLLTRGLLAVSAFITEHALSGILALLALVSSLFKLRQHPLWRVRQQQLLLRLPLISTIIRGQRLSQIYTILALCQHTGLPLLKGITSVISTLPCLLWQQSLQRISQQISEGIPLWQSVQQEKLFSPLCMQLIRTGETTGTLDLMLARLAHWHSEQTWQRAERLAGALEPAMMLIIGSIIGILVIAMYLPIFQLGDIISAS